MNGLLSDFELHCRDIEFDLEDAKHHRETCSPAGSCYIPYVANVRGEPHYCDIRRPKTPCAVCGKTEPHRGPEGCDRVFPKPGDHYVCTGSTCYDAGKPHTHRYAPIPAPGPVCESCGGDGVIPVWRMTRHGYEEATEPCKSCNGGRD